MVSFHFFPKSPLWIPLLPCPFRIARPLQNRYKWSGTAHSLLCLTYFPTLKICSFLLCPGMPAAPFHCGIIFHYLGIPQGVCPFTWRLTSAVSPCGAQHACLCAHKFLFLLGKNLDVAFGIEKELFYFPRTCSPTCLSHVRLL